GGLGGFGLELADWLILRGARNLLLISRTGIQNGYQRSRVELWKSYAVNIQIIAEILSTRTKPQKLSRSHSSRRQWPKLSRKICPDLPHFVVFLSVSCGRGNAGQTNYGMANSIMERISETRVQDGLPGLAIQWGAVGDFGHFADMQEDSKELIIGGTLQQRIQSCLDSLDAFLMLGRPIVCSMVVAEKHAGFGRIIDVEEAVANIM
ncbi:PREDICTED: fatty acid synthase-like, partial [Dinoponera quadriceps]|uniref:Fatty acid synthase-like n=1 Tax=Dinoponera quadriceps TaxID=609295 RepID=A0A6P3YC92_DINQU